MKTITFFSQKGGSGKSTLTVHSAVVAHSLGERVVIVDTDMQRTTTKWGEMRTSDEPIVATASASELSTVLKAAKSEGMTFAFVDTAPHAAPDAARVARLSDLIVIPCRPTAFDLAAVDSAVDIIKANNAKAVFVLSACPFRSPETNEAREILSGYGLPVAPISITDRRAFSRSVATGRAVTEFEKNGKAADEINNLWLWIKGQI